MSNKISSKKFYIAGSLVALFIAGFLSFYASSSPDGLEKVAGELGFIETAKDSPVSGGVLEDYGVKGLENERASVGIAGVIGVIATGVISMGLFNLLGKSKKRE